MGDVMTTDRVDERAVAHKSIFINMAAKMHEFIEEVDAGGGAHNQPPHIGSE